ncbi:hypothetical protein CC1G_13233 [Coprinopsis cinerea okayama7|uniref:G-alpha-domain-containing protein n=1 Tax=Coprinopsis cinerea (strain Okayama-7 / 130 / ATCC MYA-4618 / FGSC 9003) TaxID=240176 RepID=A8PI30_COPC7|nr:hypothetical protein CC1G_13233 [Coprinopsis cinerea okayama7\|eukprot:XP_001841506.1 hypothetical protein CC1G_13233 [Coprinopsis cinerea okayama7\
MGATDVDPFEYLTRPPPNETPEERTIRERKEVEAKKVSDQIDEEIRKERAVMKKQQNAVRVLLLGQSESGKSTTLKNFRMRYAREEWQAELASWRTVIQLNLIRSVLSILDAVQSELDNDPAEPPGTPGADETEFLHTPTDGSTSPALASPAFNHPSSSKPGQRRPSVSSIHRQLQSKASSSSLRKDALGGKESSLLGGQHQLLKLRLAPLRRVETDLRRQLGASADDEVVDGAASDEYGALGQVDAGSSVRSTGLRRRTTARKEVSVRRLKDALSGGDRAGKSKGHSRTNSEGSGDDAVDEATDVIAKCKDDIKALWMDEAVRLVLKKRKIRLEDSAGFFLDDVDRIAAREYVPSDDDVVRARLRTLGVQEYRITVDQPGSVLSGLGATGSEWLLYDVGGSRTMRHAWIPYFENITAIIFLAPVSCFDERLLEDSRINRLEDSFLLWRHVCSSKLLQKTSLILFMNKCDLLKRKLKMGVKVNKYLPSYADRPNEAGHVVKYLKEKFRDIVKANAPEGGRVAYYYATSVTDTKTTYTTLKAVKDIILRDHLKNADFV